MFSEITKIIKSGLNRKLASTVLVSILLVEFMLLLPSVIKYKESQVQGVEMQAELLIGTLNSILSSNGRIKDPKQFAVHLQNHDLVKGFQSVAQTAA